MNGLKKDAVYIIKTYAGYKGDETPRSLVSGGREWVIDRIVSRRRMIDSESRQRWDEFICRVGEQLVIIKIFSSGEKTFSFPG